MLSRATGFLGGSVVKNLPVMKEMQVWSLGQEDPLEEEMATNSSILAWKIPWTEDGLQSTGWQRVGHDLAQAQVELQVNQSVFSSIKLA